MLADSRQNLFRIFHAYAGPSRSIARAHHVQLIKCNAFTAGGLMEEGEKGGSSILASYMHDGTKKK